MSNYQFNFTLCSLLIRHVFIRSSCKRKRWQFPDCKQQTQGMIICSFMKFVIICLSISLPCSLVVSSRNAVLREKTKNGCVGNYRTLHYPVYCSNFKLSCLFMQPTEEFVSSFQTFLPIFSVR